MRYLFFGTIMLFCAIHSLAQRNLSGSIQHSLYTYAYRLNPREADALMTSGLEKVEEKHLRTLADSFLTGREIPALGQGNYLLVHTRGNKLIYRLYTSNELKIKPINNDHDLFIAVHTRQGMLLDDATVMLNEKQLPYHAASKSYGPIAQKASGAIKVYYKNTSYTFALTGQPSQRSSYRRHRGLFPFKYIASLFRKHRKKSHQRHYYRFYSSTTAYERQFKGFMVFNKPVYKPGDTVFLKAFVETSEGKLVDRPLLLRLCNSDRSTDTILSTVPPYRAGGYTYQFVLSDSLDLDLDEDYLVTLEEELKGKEKPSDDDDDDDAAAMQRKVLMRGKFSYEEYELHAITFQVRSSKKTHNRGEQLSVFLKAVDENEMAVMDGRVSIAVLANGYGIMSFHAPKVFLPDTLWTYQQPLESVGETRIDIPDSIFPKASFNYEIRCTFLNTNNEQQYETLRQAFDNNPRVIQFEQQKDSLKIDLLLSGRSVPSEGMLLAFDNAQDTIAASRMSLPGTIKINPFVSYYEIKTDSLTDSYDINKPGGDVYCLGNRTKDSIEVLLVNPSRLPVWYTVFAGDKVVLRGYGDTLLYRDRARRPGNYFVSLQYIFGNKVHKEDYTIPYRDKLLTIRSNQPEFIYPGQQVHVTLRVTDSEGKGVPGADLTAYAYTRKFDSDAPDVPYLGKIYPGRRMHTLPGLKDKEAQDYAASLNWERWSREMMLDTIEYYRFLHPRDIYVNVEPAKDSNSQIAPFVVDSGNLQAVHLLYIDEVPVFFNQSRHLQRYSFAVSEGVHSIRLRTSNKLITLDSIRIGRGIKTFLSINANATNKQLQSVSMPDTLTTHERQLWNRYMLVIDNNFGEQFAYVKQNSRQLFLLNADKRLRQDILTGPFTTNYAELIVKDRFEQTFATEGSWEYNITNGLIKQRQSCYPYLFNLQLSQNEPVFDFHDFVLTEKEIDSLWQDYMDIRASKMSFLPNYNYPGRGRGHLEIGFPADKINVPFIKNVVLIRPDESDFIRAYTGDTRSLGYLYPGKYKLVFLLKKDRYFTFDSITVLPDGRNYYEIGHIAEKEQDSFSIKITRMMTIHPSYTNTKRTSKDADHVREAIIESYRNSDVYTEAVRGTVCDDAGAPLAGVTIRVKGTSRGTLTDMQGYFSMKVPPKSTILFSYIGFKARETRSISNHYYNIELTPLTTHLDEVIVTGYAYSRKAMLTGSVSSVSFDELLQGTAAGVSIKGLSSLSSPPAPLIIVDGLPYAGKMEDLDRDQIISTNVLKGEEATSLYGSLAAGGVIIVNTRNSRQMSGDPDAAVPMNKLRRNFRDDAYWQPRLLTDADGKASFNATFPDDITSWRTFAIAMTGNKQSGFLEKAVKSFKALSANLSLPHFAIMGDSIRVIGKTLNYLSDSITVKRTFGVNNTTVKESMINVRYSKIDTLPVTADSADSLRLKYTIQKSDGYFDGEERAIPIFRPGVLATSGIFAAFFKDSTLQLQLEPDTTPIILYAESTLLPVWYDEAESIRNYEYLCNEQLASKLKALLVQKRIDQYFKRPFEKEENIRDVLDRLNKSKLQTGLWGWWSNGTPSIWISLHVLEALLAAEKSGYAVAVNKTLLIDYLIYRLEKNEQPDEVTSLHLLHQLGAKANFKKYTDSIGKKYDSLSFYEQLRLTELKQQLGLPVKLDTFIRLQQHTVFGNTYWGRESYYFFNNSIQQTLCMYRILRNAGGYDDLLQKIRGYFLEQRKTGHWRNTYESSLILDAILPDLLAEAPDLKPGTLTIRGREQEAVTSFPFYKEIRDNAPISISKKGGLPIYFTAYRRYWDEKPEKTSNNFEVSSSFIQNNKSTTLLKAGIPTDLKVNVYVESDADYVMIEVPIPAGCSYRNKNQPYGNNEVHREYVKNKVSIFCSSLPKGSYQYTISLLPRYTGTYTLNPAKAEMMYFPIFNGREAMKKVNIE